MSVNTAPTRQRVAADHRLVALKKWEYCHARLRAWEMEYRLYSIRPWLDCHQDTEADLPVVEEQGPWELSVGPVGEDALCSEGVTSDALASSPTVPVFQKQFPPGDPDMNLEALMGSIDTHSASLFELAVPDHRRPAPPAETPALTVSAIETPPAVADRPAVRTFAPLAPVVEAPAPLRAAPLKLRLPTVLSQILRDAPDHWEHLSRGVEARVKESGLRSLLVTSALQGEGATTVATALAVTVAQKTDLKVLLLDADFAHPCLADQLKLGVRVGLEHHLLDATPLAQVTVAVEEPVFDILPTLEPFQLPAMAHSSRRLEDVLDELRRHYDLIIVDLGALFADRKPIRIPLGVDAALIVRDPARCSPDLLDQLDAYIARQGVSSLGVIENGV